MEAKDLRKSRNFVIAAKPTEWKATAWQLHDIIN
jgi:hypothetical protein